MDQLCIKIHNKVKSINDCNNLESVTNIAREIIKEINDFDKKHDGKFGLCNKEYIDSYLKELIKNKRLDPKKTNINGFSYRPVCCAMFGIWSSVPGLVKRGLINNDVGGISMSNICNFCLDILNVVVGE